MLPRTTCYDIALYRGLNLNCQQEIKVSSPWFPAYDIVLEALAGRDGSLGVGLRTLHRLLVEPLPDLGRVSSHQHKLLEPWTGLPPHLPTVEDRNLGNRDPKSTFPSLRYVCLTVWSQPHTSASICTDKRSGYSHLYDSKLGLLLQPWKRYQVRMELEYPCPSPYKQNQGPGEQRVPASLLARLA